MSIISIPIQMIAYATTTTFRQIVIVLLRWQYEMLNAAMGLINGIVVPNVMDGLAEQAAIHGLAEAIIKIGTAALDVFHGV